MSKETREVSDLTSFASQVYRLRSGRDDLQASAYSLISKA